MGYSKDLLDQEYWYFWNIHPFFLVNLQTKMVHREKTKNFPKSEEEVLNNDQQLSLPSWIIDGTLDTDEVSTSVILSEQQPLGM